MTKRKSILSKESLAAIAEFNKQARAIVKDMAAERDKLRRLVEEYSDILETTDEGLHDFEWALDRMSELM